MKRHHADRFRRRFAGADPTAAAEKAVPVRVELIEQVAVLARRLAGAQRRLLDVQATRLATFRRLLASPDQALGGPVSGVISHRSGYARPCAPAMMDAGCAWRARADAGASFATGGAGARERKAEGIIRTP